MNGKSQVEASGLDTVKLILAVGIIVGAIVGFYYLDGYSQLLRVLGLLVLIGAAMLLAYQTAVGRTIWDFASASRMEVRKVVWPSRQETMQTTLIVFVMVLLMGIVLWLFDMMLGAILRSLTGA
ncbi:MAG: preprotein translocase subunit SecE [Candidatus Thiodiazotropha sp.]